MNEEKHKFRITRGQMDTFEDLGEEMLTLEEAKFKALHEEVVCQLVRE